MKQSVIILFFLLLYFFPLENSDATTSESLFFTVNNLRISSTNAKNLRKKAIENGIKSAFSQVLDRITLKQDRQQLSDWQKMDLELFVNHYSLSEEDISPHHYEAILSVRFNAEAIKSYLKENKLSIILAPEREFLILPILVDQKQTKLWFDDNPWYQAWVNQLQSIDSNAIQLQLPLRDLQDIQISKHVKKLVNGDMQTIKAIAKRYNVDDVLVCIAFLKDDSVEIALNPFGKIGKDIMAHFHYELSESAFSNTYKDDQGHAEKIQDILSSSTARLVENIEQSWKKHNSLSFEKRLYNVKIDASIMSLQEWQQLKHILALIQEIQSYSVLSLGKLQTQIEVQSYYDIQELSQIFQLHKLHTKQINEQHMEIKFDKPDAAPYFDKATKVQTLE